MMTVVRLVLVSACALVDGQGRVLLAQRPVGKTLEGLWEFPGGKIEPGESPETALARELREELDIGVAVGDFEPLTFASHAYEAFHLLMPLYLCRRWQGAPVRREHAAFAWLRPAEMTAYPLAPADIALAKALAAAL